MKIIVCPKCGEVLTVIDNKDFIVCPKCNNVTPITEKK
jgi:uncharacterized protein YbaR (Trm112 family)